MVLSFSKDNEMAHRPKEVRVKDVRQGKTIWLVDIVIPDGVPSEQRIEWMKRYPHSPERWANDDAWGRTRLRAPERLFVHDSRDILEELSYLFETSKAFHRRKDAIAYHQLVAEFALRKKRELIARFPAFINPPKNWIGKDAALVLAEVPLDLSMKFRPIRA
jgi:hypothetical protein